MQVATFSGHTYHLASRRARRSPRFADIFFYTSRPFERRPARRVSFSIASTPRATNSTHQSTSFFFAKIHETTGEWVVIFKVRGSTRRPLCIIYRTGRDSRKTGLVARPSRAVVRPSVVLHRTLRTDESPPPRPRARSSREYDRFDHRCRTHRFIHSSPPPQVRDSTTRRLDDAVGGRARGGGESRDA